MFCCELVVCYLLFVIGYSLFVSGYWLVVIGQLLFVIVVSCSLSLSVVYNTRYLVTSNQ